jgi:hypothetical protein
MIGGRNVKGGLVGLAFGLAGGLAMSLYAFVPLLAVPAWLLEYDDLSRRLLRLAHIAGVMLPLINVVLGPWLDRLVMSESGRRVASWLLLAGSATVPAALVVEAWWPVTRPWHVAALPVLAFCGGVFVVAVAAWGTPSTALDGVTAESSPTRGGASPAAHEPRTGAITDIVDAFCAGRLLAPTARQPRTDTGAEREAGR